MNTIPEKELKDHCTPDAIKWMVELAEGFEFIGDVKIYLNDEYIGSIKNIFCNKLAFSTLIRRAVDGWNEKNRNGISTHYDCILYNSETPKLYKFKNYKKESLTLVECACLRCLLDIFEEERKCNADAVKQK